MPNVTKITVTASVKVAQNYNSCESGAMVELEILDGEDCSKIRREYGLSLRRQLRAEAEEALSALLERRMEMPLK